MVATVGSISIDLSTNAAKFATGFKSAATTVETQSSRMAKSIAAIERNTTLAAGTLKNFGTGLAAGAGLAAIASLGGAFDKLKQTISEYDEIATNAKTTGLNTDTYQALAFAAQKANISQESYNSALNIFAKNAGLAAIGQGALFSGLKKLNPELLQNILNTKDQEERLKLVADAMAQTSDATEKAALSAAIFGKGGVEISRILEDGRASIDRFKESAKKLGVVVPENLLERGKEIDGILDDLTKIANIQLGEGIIQLAPLLIAAAKGFADFAREFNHFSQEVDNFESNPSLDNFLALVRGDAKVGLLDKIRDGLNAMAEGSHRSTAEILADMDRVQETLNNLQRDAAIGLEVGVQSDRAIEDLKDLQRELEATQTAGVTAAKAISTAFAQAFRESENASMDALAKMNAELGKPSNQLPTVHRYGGDPNKIELPNNRFSYQENANGSGVNRTSFGGDEYQRKTVDNTEDTADNVQQLDTNTKGYISDLSRDIGQYSAQQIQAQNIVINKLSDVTAQTFGMLSSAILGALVLNNDSGATGSGDTMFGDAFDSQYGSYISSWGVGKVKRGSYDLAPTSDDGTSNTSISVAQPGNPLTFVYNAAPGVSNETARQQARDMYNELTLQAMRA